MREIFIKTDNLLAGQYLAEITREVISDMEASKYQMAEWRVSIYGRKLSEWDKLARWFYVHQLAHPCIRWLIQIPRLYHLYRKMGEVKNFEDMVTSTRPLSLCSLFFFTVLLIPTFSYLFLLNRSTIYSLLFSM